MSEEGNKSHKNCSAQTSSDTIEGKAPQKQLATKAAHKQGSGQGSSPNLIETMPRLPCMKSGVSR